ncbi:hypothetical protein SCLARK_001652 [Spiroplasma clarkii]|nr:hypothetical protein [Spiroplasma clarkii]ARU92120.1 hypothetical protein SCLARK_001652 [Spiroplasma clarkii]
MSFFKSVGVSFREEQKSLKIPQKYKTSINNILKTIGEYLPSKDFNLVIDHFYLINEMISDLLETLEEDPDNLGKFTSESEVLLYNLAISFSTTYYFGLLLYEKILACEEAEGYFGRIIDKPISEENDARVAEAQVVGSEGEDIYYKTLKN